MTNDQPTEPITGYELDNIEGRWQRYVALRDEDSMETSVHDVPDLLAEVDRLRAENAAVKTQRDQFQKMMNSTVSAGVTIDGERLDALRERDALRAQLDAARKALFDDAFEGHAQRYRALARALGGTDA